MTSSKPNHLPKMPPLTVITLRLRASTYGFWENTIQSLVTPDPEFQTVLYGVPGAPLWRHGDGERPERAHTSLSVLVRIVVYCYII